MDKRTRISFDDAVELIIRHWLGERQSSLAMRYNITQGQVSHVVRGASRPDALTKAEEYWRKHRMPTRLR